MKETPSDRRDGASLSRAGPAVRDGQRIRARTRRFLNSEAVVTARAPSAGYRLRKFVKRNRGRVIAASLVLVALLAGIVKVQRGVLFTRATVVTSTSTRSPRTERHKAEQSEAKARRVGPSRGQRTRAEAGTDDRRCERFRDAVTNERVEELNATGKVCAASPEGSRDVLQRLARPATEPTMTPRFESLARLAQASYDLGDLTTEIGDQQDALKAYRESLAIHQSWPKRTAVTEYQRSLGNGAQHRRRTEVDRRTGRGAPGPSSRPYADLSKLADAGQGWPISSPVGVQPPQTWQSVIQDMGSYAESGRVAAGPGSLRS